MFIYWLILDFCRLFFWQLIALYRTCVSRGDGVQQVSPAAGVILHLVSTYNVNWTTADRPPPPPVASSSTDTQVKPPQTEGCVCRASPGYTQGHRELQRLCTAKLHGCLKKERCFTGPPKQVFTCKCVFTITQNLNRRCDDSDSMMAVAGGAFYILDTLNIKWYLILNDDHKHCLTDSCFSFK